jgi:hypothetical protein
MSHRLDSRSRTEYPQPDPRTLSTQPTEADEAKKLAITIMMRRNTNTAAARKMAMRRGMREREPIARKAAATKRRRRRPVTRERVPMERKRVHPALPVRFRPTNQPKDEARSQIPTMMKMMEAMPRREEMT